MDEFKRYNNGDVRIEKVNLVRATMNEAQEIRDNLLEDYLVFKKIVVDLSDCEYIDSTFFGALVFAYKHLKSKGGSIKLVMGNSFMRRTFIFRDIERIFDVHNTLREAINAYETDEKKIPVYD
jgi:anti-anti-sigma factor